MFGHIQRDHPASQNSLFDTLAIDHIINGASFNTTWSNVRYAGLPPGYLLFHKKLFDACQSLCGLL